MTQFGQVDHSIARSAVLAAVLAAALLAASAQLEVLGPLDWLHPLGLALRALELQHNLLRRLRLLVEDRLRLAAETSLLLVVAALPLSCEGGLARFVLGHLVRGVLGALPAVSVAGLRDVHHRWRLGSE